MRVLLNPPGRRPRKATTHPGGAGRFTRTVTGRPGPGQTVIGSLRKVAENRCAICRERAVGQFKEATRLKAPAPGANQHFSSRVNWKWMPFFPDENHGLTWFRGGQTSQACILPAFACRAGRFLAMLIDLALTVNPFSSVDAVAGMEGAGRATETGGESAYGRNGPLPLTRSSPGDGVNPRYTLLALAAQRVAKGQGWRRSPLPGKKWRTLSFPAMRCRRMPRLWRSEISRTGRSTLSGNGGLCSR